MPLTEACSGAATAAADSRVVHRGRRLQIGPPPFDAALCASPLSSLPPAIPATPGAPSQERLSVSGRTPRRGESTVADVRPADEPKASTAQGGWKTRDFIVIAAIAVVLGLVWSLGWVHVWLVARGILPEFGFFVAGFYVAAAVLSGYIIRRPGAALLGEMIAALIEVPLTVLGPVALILGLLQGLGVEAVFAATRYRNWGWTTLILAGVAGAALGFVYEAVAFGYLNLGIRFGTAFGARELGGALLGGLLSKVIGDALARTGVLNNFPIARDRVREV